MKIELVSEWRSWWKMYSIWVAAFVAVLPDLVNLAVSMELITAEQIPPYFSYSLKVAMFTLAGARLIKQEALRRSESSSTSVQSP